MNDENTDLDEQPETENGSDDIPTARMIDEAIEDATGQLDATEDSGSASIETEATDSVVEELRKKLDEAEKRALLHQADLENFRRRKSKESQDAIRYASLPLLNGLLEVSDNLQRALDSAKDDADAASLREGVQLVANQLFTTLENHGCKKIPALGEVFDPNRHEAIQMQPGDEPLNTIVMDVQSGFTLHDRVVRPAKVIISTGPADKK